MVIARTIANAIECGVGMRTMVPTSISGCSRPA